MGYVLNWKQIQTPHVKRVGMLRFQEMNGDKMEIQEYTHVSEWNPVRDKICNTDKAMSCLNEIMCSAPCQVVLDMERKKEE